MLKTVDRRCLKLAGSNYSRSLLGSLEKFECRFGVNLWSSSQLVPWESENEQWHEIVYSNLLLKEIVIEVPFFLCGRQRNIELSQLRLQLRNGKLGNFFFDQRAKHNSLIVVKNGRTK